MDNFNDFFVGSLDDDKDVNLAGSFEDSALVITV